MIGTLAGKLAAKQVPRLLVEVGGVGYEVEVPMSTVYALPPVGGDVRLFTHLLVREDAHVLYGFATEPERSLFRGLLKVSGVGARVGLAVLSGVTVDQFVRCVTEGDAATLTRIPGIGRKTADRLIVEMRDRLAGAAPAGEAPIIGAAAQGPREEAQSALVALGYKPAEAVRMLDAVRGEGRSSEDLIRLALQAVARGRG